MCYKEGYVEIIGIIRDFIGSIGIASRNVNSKKDPKLFLIEFLWYFFEKILILQDSTLRTSALIRVIHT